MKNILLTITLSLISLTSYAGDAPPPSVRPPVDVPEPSSLALFGAAFIAIFLAKKFKK